MGIRDFARSLKPGNDRELAATQYAGRTSASEDAAAARRRRHRESVLKHGDNQPGKVPRRFKKHNG